MSATIATAAVQVAILVGPVALATSIAAVGMHGFQGGWSFAPGALKLHWSRLSPATGMSRFSFSQSGVETIKIMITATAIVYFAWTAIDGCLADAPQLAWLPPVEAGRSAWKHAELLLWRVAWTLAALALADYGVQRYRWMRRSEDDAAGSPGRSPPERRQPRGQGAHATHPARDDAPPHAQRRGKNATVVITNPTHFAVALEYQPRTMAAPRRRGQGPRPNGARIQESRAKHGVPLVENKRARARLYTRADVGDVIPAAALLGASPKCSRISFASSS